MSGPKIVEELFSLVEREFEAGLLKKRVIVVFFHLYFLYDVGHCMLLALEALK